MSWMVAPIVFGGYASTKDSDVGQINQFASIAQNLDYTEYGGIKTMRGLVDVTGGNQNTANRWGNSTFMRAAFHHVLSTGTNGWLGAVAPSNDYGSTNLRFYYSTSESALAPVYLSSAYDSTTVCFTQLNNKVLIGFDSGSQPILGYYHGNASLSTMATAPSAKYLDTHYSRAFGASSLANPSRIWWSNISTPETWDTGASGQWLDVNPDDGQPIKGIKSFGGDMYVFKNTKVYKITGTDFDPVAGDYVATELPGVPGCITHKSIVVARGEMYWCSPNGFVKYDGSKITPIGYGLVDREFGCYTLGYADIGFPDACYDNNRQKIYWIQSFSYIYSYSLITGKWSTVSIGNALVPQVIVAKNNTAEVMWFCYKAPASSQQYSIFPYNINNAIGDSATYYRVDSLGIDWRYQTDWVDFGSWQRKGSPKLLMDIKRAITAGISLSCDVFFDYDTQATHSFAFEIDTAGSQIQTVIEQMQDFRVMRLLLKNTNTDSPITINKIAVEYYLDTESGRV